MPWKMASLLLTKIVLLAIHTVSVRSPERVLRPVIEPMICTIEEKDHLPVDTDIVQLAEEKAFMRLSPIANFSLNRTFIFAEDVFDFISNGCKTLSERCTTLAVIASCPVVTALGTWAADHSIPHLVLSPGHVDCRVDSGSGLHLAPVGQVSSDVLRVLIQHVWNWREMVFLYDEFLEAIIPPPKSISQHNHIVKDPRIITEIHLMLSQIPVTTCSFIINDDTSNATMNEFVSVTTELRHVLVAVASHRLHSIYEVANHHGQLSQDYKWVVMSNTSCQQALNSSHLVNSNLLFLRYIYADIGSTLESCQSRNVVLEDDMALSTADLLSAGIEAMVTATATEEYELGMDWSPSVCDKKLLPLRRTAIELMRKARIRTDVGTVIFDPSTGRVASAGFEFCSTDKASPKGFGTVGSWSPASPDNFPADSSLFSNTFRDFGGRQLLIAAKEAPPFLLKKRQGNQTVFEGFCISIVQELATRLKFTYKIVEPKDGLTGAPAGNGNWSGLIGMVIRKEVDFAVGPLSITAPRSVVIDFTTPFMEDGVGIITKKPDIGSDTMFRLFKAMQPMVWACLCASVIGISFVIYLVNHWSPYSQPNSCTTEAQQLRVFQCFWSALGSTLSQGSEFQPKSSSGRIVLGFWWVFTIILVSTYTANMAAVLTITIYDKPINSLAELASQSEIKPLVKVGSNLETLLQEAKDSIYRKIWHMKIESGLIVITNEQALELVRTRDTAFMTDRSQLEYIVMTNCETYALADDVFNTGGMGFVLPKNAEFLPSFDVIIMKLKESGIIDGWRRQWWSDPVKKCSDNDRISTVDQLDLKYLAGPFFVFLGAMTVSIVVVVIEKACMTDRCRSEKRNVVTHDVASL